MKRVFLLLLAVTIPCVAALPPLSQSKKEVEAILSSPELTSSLPQSDIIEQIVRVENGYLIITNYRTMFIEIEYLKDGKIGPAKFKLIFHRPQDR